MENWAKDAIKFLHYVQTPLGASSVPNGPITLYGTCYAWMGLYYLNNNNNDSSAVKSLINFSQDDKSGLFVGPELLEFEAPKGSIHDHQHLLLHLTCTVLPIVQEMKLKVKPVIFAQKFYDLEWLTSWQNSIDWRHAWFEGNNILFVGQLLVYLRDVENHPQAAGALECWFEWLDKKMDHRTNLWGTNGYCNPAEAVYGGYHQLLVYFHENREIKNPQGLIDTVLSLQHADGGFNPNGNAGACEDVDSVDILVNCYKRYDYRRPSIRHSLRRCLKHILSTQNSDGGFPYNRNQKQSHMGIPGTEAAPNVSCTFPTWFRIHTLALIAEVLPNEPDLQGIPFRFNSSLSMGWHQSPLDWIPMSDAMTIEERRIALFSKSRRVVSSVTRLVKKIKNYVFQ